MTLTEAVDKAANVILASFHREYAPRTDMRLADPAAFPHVDQDFYKHTQQFLEGKGFAFIADFERAKFNHAYPDFPTFERYMVGDDNAIVASFFSLEMKGKSRALGLRFATDSHPKIIEFATLLDDGAVLFTHNGRSTRPILAPPGVFMFRLRGLPTDELLENHRGRLAWLLSQRPGARPVQIATVEKILECANRIKLLYHVYAQDPDFDLDRYAEPFVARYSGSARRSIIAAFKQKVANKVVPPEDAD